MFIYLLIAFGVVGIVANVSTTMVKLQVNAKLPENERFSWWVHYTNEVGRRHRELFPDSALSDIALYSRLACLFLFVSIVLISIFNR